MIAKDEQNENGPVAGTQRASAPFPQPGKEPPQAEKTVKNAAQSGGGAAPPASRKEDGDRPAKFVLAVLIGFLAFSILLYLEGWLIVFLTVSLLTLAAGIVGCFRPRWVVFWSGKKTRKRAAAYFAAAAIAFCCAAAILFFRGPAHGRPRPGPGFGISGLQSSLAPPASSPDKKKPFFLPTEPFEFPF